MNNLKYAKEAIVIMRLDKLNAKQRLPFRIDFQGILLYFIIFCTLCACSANRRVIKNPELNHWDVNRRMHQNLFPAEYGYLEETDYDSLEFRKPHEKGVRKYAFLSDPRGDIDRTKGYDAAEFTIVPDMDLLNDPAYEVQITWIRHASFLIQLGDRYQILVDPVMEELDGLVGKFGKFSDIGTLYAATPLATEDLPFVDDSEKLGETQDVIVAISHDHHDHLNYNTFEKLPEGAHYYVPMGLEKKFPFRYSNVTGMDWYTQDAIGDLTITFLPANHRSGRTMNKMNDTLWGGWLFEWNDYRVYFSGDSGYSAVFKDIKNRVGEFDICLMPITAWFQRHWHFAPEDAVRAAEDLNCKVLIPWGWGTWIISFEHILEPPRRLQYAWEEMQPENMELRMLNMGETYAVGLIAEDQCTDCE